ncbi:MAG TPA: GxxExxY protein [Longimicrobiales bacterium]
MDINRITERIIGAALKVHSTLGPGLPEIIYERCLAIELAKQGLRFQCQVAIAVIYDGIRIAHDYYVDILVENAVVVEIKAVDRVAPVHTAQLIGYLKLTGCAVGLLINFNSLNLRDGVKRVVMNYSGPFPRFPRPPRPSS